MSCTFYISPPNSADATNSDDCIGSVVRGLTSIIRHTVHVYSVVLTVHCHL